MGMITARPATRHEHPAYPTKLAVQATPSLLAEHVPAAWLSRVELSGALAAFLALNTAGCGDKGAKSNEAGASGGSIRKPAVVAPIFAHGDGTAPARGALGCVAVAAPVFLSEEEALQVIQEVLQTNGLDLPKRDVEFDAIRISGREMQQGHEWLSGRDDRGWVKVEGPLEADLYNAELGIAIEYVAREDFDQLGGDDSGPWTMSLKSVAESVAHEVDRQGSSLGFGAFYDPVTYYYYFSGGWRGDDGKFADSSEDAKAMSEEMLRLQVQDFVDWLKGQGVI